MANDYDRKAEEYDWRGPEVAFGLAYVFVRPGESVLDIGIGTGLSSALFHKAGLRIYGMDASAEMLAACRSKGFAEDLVRHDLTAAPYPFASASLDHAVCLGVLNHFRDLRVVFSEVARVLRSGGVFAFVVGDRGPGEEAELVVGPEHTGTGASAVMYRHGAEEIAELLRGNGFELMRSLEFPVPMDRQRASVFRARAYVCRKG